MATKKQFNEFVKEDNIKFSQGAKSADLKLGQTCTIYLMNKASGRKRKKITAYGWRKCSRRG
jgi:hypothetical protein